MAHARCKRIVRPLSESYPLQPDLLTEPASAALLRAYHEQYASIQQGNPETLYTALCALVQPINTFFADILVMHEEAGIRAARLGLVQAIARLTDGFADLSRLQGF